MAMEFKKKTKVESRIPTASLPDIVFLLLIFFMVTTVFKEYSGLQVKLPTAKQIEKLPGKRGIAYLWADRAGNISIDDKLVGVEDIQSIMYAKRADRLHPLIAVSMKIDEKVKMGTVADIQEQLRKADALQINYSAKPSS
jgi:biopolymer transport protein ExbD